MFASLYQKAGCKPGTGSQRRVRLGVEVLEGRATPSAVMTNHLPFVALPSTNATALSTTTGSGVHVQLSGIGEEIPQLHSSILRGSKGEEIPQFYSSIGEEIPQLYGIGEELRF